MDGEVLSGQLVFASLAIGCNLPLTESALSFAFNVDKMQ